MKLVLVTILALSVVPLLLAGTLDIHQLRMLAAKNNVTCIFVFGDSSVDPGNNNRLRTTFKGNFPPYGKDFPNGLPTGRFSDGRLATDFIAEAAGFTKAIPAFLDPKLKREDLLHGISFASAASGYDDLTANLSSVLPVSKQLEYFKHYKIHLRQLVGVKRAEEIVTTAIFILSMGTNDFLQNYYLETIRAKQYNVEEYQNYLVSRMYEDIKEMHRLGARRLVVVGVPPLGCLPLMKTLMDQTTCVESYNKVAFSFNSKIQEKLHIVRRVLGIRNGYLDIYTMIADAVNNPKKYGFTETTKGCCGSGILEYGLSCKGMTTCADPSKYVFWDAVHPTQRMYQIIADEGLQALNRYVFS
ncbi:GDSL esterase/lipase At5g45950 [Tripterygium wilfordii]|uniref:GDSL esterase/lipase At5g45950 n=1 Tax=Tripterygium wilfordii TaxID=458696 RepID=UPI0018F80CAD|nr:GDSL esterase/lipase At5g45950 [Tripterygium wilfordii]